MFLYQNVGIDRRIFRPSTWSYGMTVDGCRRDCQEVESGVWSVVDGTRAVTRARSTLTGPGPD